MQFADKGFSHLHVAYTGVSEDDAVLCKVVEVILQIGSDNLSPVAFCLVFQVSDHRVTVQVAADAVGDRQVPAFPVYGKRHPGDEPIAAYRWPELLEVRVTSLDVETYLAEVRPAWKIIQAGRRPFGCRFKQ